MKILSKKELEYIQYKERDETGKVIGMKSDAPQWAKDMYKSKQENVRKEREEWRKNGTLKIT